MPAVATKPATAISLSLNTKTLANAFSLLSKVIATNPIVPILENVHVTMEESELVLRASDLKNTMITRIAYSPEIGGKRIVFLLPYKLTLDLMKSLPNTVVVLQYNPDSYVSTVFLDKQKFVITGESPVDYPKQSAIEGASVTFKSNALSEALRYTINSASEDPIRPALTGVFFDTTESATKLVASNGHVITVCDLGVSCEVSSFLVMKDAAQIIADILPGSDEITFQLNSNTLYVESGDIIVISQLLDERFVDYRNAMPSSYSYEVTVDLDEWRSVLKRALLFSNRTTHTVKHIFDTDKLGVVSEDIDYQNEAAQTIALDGNLDQELNIGYNGKLLMTLIQPASGLATISVSAPNRLTQIEVKTTEIESVQLCIMPVMLNNHV